MRAIAVVLLFVGITRADQIEVRDGKPIVGKVQKESPTEVEVAPQGAAGTQTVAVNRIVSIHYDGQAPALTNAKILEDAYNLARAAEEYAKAQAELKSKPFALQAAQFGEARSLARLALDGSNRLDDAIARLNLFARAHADSRHHFALHELLGRLHLAKKDYARAEEALAELARAPWPEGQLQAALYRGRMLLAQNKLDEATARFDEVASAKIDSVELQTVQVEALFEKARCLHSRGARDDEIATLEQVIARAPANAISLQAEAYTALGDAYRAAGRTKHALVAFLHVDLLFAKDKELHARALYNLTQLWLEVGQPGRAAATRATLKNEHPNSAWHQKLAP
jgi:tetratricopeptide (TPR) repeat protein